MYVGGGGILISGIRVYTNPNVIGRAKTKDCRMIPGHSSTPLFRSPIFLSACAFFLDLYVRMPFQGNQGRFFLSKDAEQAPNFEVLLAKGQDAFQTIWSQYQKRFPKKSFKKVSRLLARDTGHVHNHYQ